MAPELRAELDSRIHNIEAEIAQCEKDGFATGNDLGRRYLERLKVHLDLFQPPARCAIN